MLNFLNNDVLENKTYGLNTTETTYVVEFNNPVIQDAIDLIKGRIIMLQNDSNGARYIDVSQYGIQVNGELLVEIIWD